MALIYAHLGQKDLAFEWLGKGVDEYDQLANWMNPNPAFDIMRSDPRFAALVRKMGLEPTPLATIAIANVNYFSNGMQSVKSRLVGS